MLKKIVWVILFQFTCWLPTHLYGQAIKASNDFFVPRETVFFEDDLSKDNATIVPEGWKAERRQGDFRSIEIKTGHETFEGRGLKDIFLKPDTHNRLPDSFTLECEVFFSAPHTLAPNDIGLYSGWVDVCFYHPGDTSKDDSSRQYCYGFYPLERSMETANWSAGRLPYYRSPPLKFFDFSKWHNIAISYRLREMKYYLDGKCLAVIPDCGYDPDYLHIQNWLGVKYSKVTLATGKEVASFKNILTEKKFVTHAINFDVNKAAIKPESAPFMKQLADFLNENPKISIEIDGHTDNDGGDAANRALSQARAEAVKTRLIALGIKATRLTARGFGATKPIKPNNTAEDKAENRRVEFIKL